MNFASVNATRPHFNVMSREEAFSLIGLSDDKNNLSFTLEAKNLAKNW
jgi:hypothetical protein